MKEKSNVIAFPDKRRERLSDDKSAKKQPQADFRHFGMAIAHKQTDFAAKILEQLLGFDSATATRAARHFQSRFDADPGFLNQAMMLRQHLQGNENNAAIALFIELFGVDGPSAIMGIETIRQNQPFLA